jgi:hypothetical protein
MRRTRPSSNADLHIVISIPFRNQLTAFRRGTLTDTNSDGVLDTPEVEGLLGGVAR